LAALIEINKGISVTGLIQATGSVTATSLILGSGSGVSNIVDNGKTHIEINTTIGSWPSFISGDILLARSGGNVAIGKINAQDLLDVNGAIRYVNNLKPNGVAATNKQILSNNGTNDLFVNLDTSYISDWSTAWDNEYNSITDFYRTINFQIEGYNRELFGYKMDGFDVAWQGVDLDYMTYSLFLKGYDSSGNVLSKPWENLIDPVDGRWYKIDQNGVRKKYLIEGEGGTTGTQVVPSLQSVSNVGRNSDKRLQFNGINYATVSDLVVVGGVPSLQSVSAVGANSTNRLQFNGVNYATVNEIQSAGSINTVLSNGNVATDKLINFNISTAHNQPVGIEFLNNQELKANLTYQKDIDTVLFTANTSDIFISSGSGKLSLGGNIAFTPTWVDENSHASEAAAKTAGKTKGDIFHINGAIQIVTTW
jgi:hypothetical protein